MTVLTTAPRKPSQAPVPPRQSASFRQWVREHSRFFYGTLGLVLLFTAWQVVTALGLVDVTIASSPSRIARAEVDLFRSGEVWTPLAGTASEVGLGLLISLLVSIPVGLIIGRVRALYDMTEPMVNILNSVPYVLFLPIIIFWFGIGQTSRVLIVIWAASIPLIINTSAGVRNLNSDYARVARVFCAGRLLFYRSVLLPATLPYILTGIRLFRLAGAGSRHRCGILLGRWRLGVPGAAFDGELRHGQSNGRDCRCGGCSRRSDQAHRRTGAPLHALVLTLERESSWKA